MSDHGDVVARIINLVKQYPALYDTTHEDYNRYYKKIQIWNSIAADVNYSDGKIAQTKWRNIRDSYVKHLKSLRTLEPAYKKYRNWQWVEQMSFLQKFLGGNKQKQNSKDDDSHETSVIDTVESVYVEPSITIVTDSDSFENIAPSGPKYKGEPNASGSPLWFNSTTLPSPSNNPPKMMKGESISSPPPLWFNGNGGGGANGGDNDLVERIETTPAECDFSSYQSKEYYLEHHGIDPSCDATDLLFLSHAKTLKGLSKKRQIQVKMKIAEIMGQAELEEENERQKTESNQVDSSGANEPVKTKKRKREFD